MKQMKITLEQHIELLNKLKGMTFVEDEMVYNEVVTVYNDLNVFYFVGTEYSARIELQKKGYKVDVIHEEGYNSGAINFTCYEQTPEEVVDIIESSVAVAF